MVGHPAGFQDRLSPDARSAMASLGQLQSFESGEVIVAKGARDAFVFLIEDGECEVMTDATAPLSVGSGDLIGEVGFLEGSERSTVIARTALRARRIARNELAQGLAPQPETLHAVLDAIRALRQERSDEGALSDADKFVAELSVEGLAHRAVTHPYLKALEDGDLPDVRWALTDFARHYYGYSRMFPRYLTTVIAKLDRPEHRAALLDNLTEESGTYGAEEIAELAEHGVEQDWYDGVPHPQLFARFADYMGAPLSTQDEADQVICWREMFLDVLGRGSAAEAVGALGLGTENIVSTIYIPFVKAVERLGIPTREAVFFPLHTTVDDDHQEVLQRIAASFAINDEGRRDLRRGMLKALQCRSAFWDWLWDRAQQPERAEGVL